MATTPPDITGLLAAWSDGDPTALAALTPLVHAELRRMARHYMAGEAPGHTLRPTELVNEAYVRLAEWKEVRVRDRGHFFAMAARLMRRILVDHARRRDAMKRDHGAVTVPLSEAAGVADERCVDFVALDVALQALAEVDPRKSQIVELRFFGGLSVEEAASAMELSPRTIIREWSLAQAWLHRELQRR